MQIHFIIATFEHPMLVPPGLTDMELITSSLQSRSVSCFVARVCQDKNDVDDRLGRKARNGCGSDVFEAQGVLAKDRSDSLGLLLKSVWPLRVVLNQKNRSG